MQIEISEKDIEKAIVKLTTKSMWNDCGLEKILQEVVKEAAKEHLIKKLKEDKVFLTKIHDLIDHVLVTTMASVGKDIALCISEGIERGLSDKFRSD